MLCFNRFKRVITPISDSSATAGIPEYFSGLHQIVGRHQLVLGAQKYRTRYAVSHEQLVELCLRVGLGAEFRRFLGRSIFPLRTECSHLELCSTLMDCVEWFQTSRQKFVVGAWGEYPASDECSDVLLNRIIYLDRLKITC